METTILQGARNVLLHSGWEVSHVCIGEPRIVELADVETELGGHHLEACNPQLYVGVSDVHLIAAAIAEKEIVNQQMPDTNPIIGRFISIEERGESIHPYLNEKVFHSRQLCNRLIAQCAVRSVCKKHSNYPLKPSAIEH